MDTRTQNFSLTIFLMALAVLASFTVVSCGGGTQQLITKDTIEAQNRILVKAEAVGYELPLTAVYQSLEKSTLLPRGGILDTGALRTYIDSVVYDTLLGFKSQSIKLTEHLPYFQIYRTRMIDELMRGYFDYELSPHIVDSTDARNYYESHPEKFTFPEQVLAYTILISPYRLVAGKDSLEYRPLSPEARMQKAYQYALDVRAKITSPDKFSQVAREYSHENTADATGGMMGWVMRGVFLAPFDSVVFSLDTNEISMPYRDKDGWHIMMVTEKMAAGLQPMEGEFYMQAMQYAQAEIVNELGSHLADSLMTNATFTYNDSVLALPLEKCDPLSWIACMNGTDTLLVDDVLSRNASYKGSHGGAETTPEVRKELIRSIAPRYRAAGAARDLGLDTLPQMKESLEFLEHLNQKNCLRSSYTPPAYEPTEEEIQRYYKEHRDEYYLDKPMVVQHIIAGDSVSAMFIRDQARSGIDFMQLALDYYPGEPKVRAELANMGAIGESDVSPEFWKAALVTPVGEVSDPVKLDHGYEIIKVISRKENKDIEIARPYIVPTLIGLHAQQYYESVRKSLFNEYGVRYQGKLPQVQLRPRQVRSAKTSGG